MKNIANIPDNGKQRVVIAGGGFAGLKLARALKKSRFQVVLLDKNNYHQFQPLFYQVATAGLEPSAISFPLRKVFQEQPDIHFRVATLDRVDTEKQVIRTDIGSLHYDYLVLALGATTNYFGNDNIRQNAVPMKSLTEAIDLRNTILSNFELALNETDADTRHSLLNIVIVGGGPTGVELAGALAEMKKYILPKDYPELDFNQMKISLLEASDKVLNGYSEASSRKAKAYLEKLDVEVRLKAMVKDYDGSQVTLEGADPLETHTLIWAAGVKANSVPGMPEEAAGRGGRLAVNEFTQVKGFDNIFAIGDMALMTTDKKYPNGHPQVAQVAMQQAALLGKNLNSEKKKAFRYVDKGSLATVGRNLAVADLPGLRFQGFFAWVLWLFVHLMAILGVKNRLFVFINWAWSYFTYDQSLRLLINPKRKSSAQLVEEEV
ncbi:MAG TPA: NAD(P)/FAD-dependent oxidoreductase [Flavilitoribacter sp.]|nr:NAD(P)/FAD-dependent oxidoreductase [Flavilitoribacter sp.]HMQ87558.1 NAD(P)/FAD-dependent oxidoreductase [Flavilitoribacter sp.]